MLTTKKAKNTQIARLIVPYFSHVHPNTLTLISLFPSIVFFVAIITSHFIFALIFLPFSLLDMLDGMVARAYHKTSIFGEVLDSTIDRITDFLYISAFGFAQLVPLSIVFPFLLVSFLTSYVRARGELALAKKSSLAVGFIERPERIIGIFLSLLLFTLFPHVTIFSLNFVSLGFLLVTCLAGFTVLQRMQYIKNNSSRKIT